MFYVFLSQIKEIISEQEYTVRFFIELSECKVNINKIKSFEKNKEEFSKTKLKKLINIIKISKAVSKGIMTFEQHEKFVKDGIRLYEDQIAELEKIKKEKERLEEKKKEKEKEKINNINGIKKLGPFKKLKFLGKKRFAETRNNYNMTKDLICSIDEFIFHKRDVKLFNGYDDFFNNMKKKISESKLNTNGLNVRKYYNNIIFIDIIQAILKLVKYMNNSRNFATEISNKNSFISLKEEINKKIKETLFDQNLLFLSSSFNYFCSTYNSRDLIDEAKNISNLLDNHQSLINEEEKIENISLNENPNTKSPPIEDKENSETKKKYSESEDEKSSSFGSKYTKFSQAGENKQKLYICFMKYPELIKILDFKNDKKENEENICLDEINEGEGCEEKLKKKIIKMENEIENNKNIEIKKRYLRKMVCLKLYKALHFALKNFYLDEEQIKHICLYIEIQGRILDMSMGIKYKEFIENILKSISAEKI